MPIARSAHTAGAHSTVISSGPKTLALTGVGASGAAGTMTASATTPQLTWTNNGSVGPISLGQNSFYDLSQHISDPLGQLASITANVTLPIGVQITNTPTWRLTATASAATGPLSNVILSLVPTAQSDWASRIAGPQVVWYHNFENDAEVNQFRWTGGYSGGNDPLSRGSGAQYITRVASGGPGNAGFLRATYPLGSATGRGNSMWYRPFNAFTGAGNGRGSNDPGASGTITPVAFPASDGSSTLYVWGNATNPGYFGHATHVAANPTKFIGNDFWFQIRVRRAQTPGAPPDTAEYQHITGKHVWFTTTNNSYTGQELVSYGQSVSNGDVVGQFSRQNVYVGQNFNSLSGGQPNATVTLANTTINWRFSGGWDTLLYHITPGTQGGTGTNRTRVEVWAQHDPTLVPAESGLYTKIWDVTYTQNFDTGTNSAGAQSYVGWNAIICGCYHNGTAFTTSSFNFDYAQMIMSKATIPAPAA